MDIIKKDFENLNQQMTYTNRFIERNTNIEKECCFCGRKTNIHHIKGNARYIQLICDECQKNKNLYQMKLDGEIIGVPIIDIMDFLTGQRVLEKITPMSEEEKKFIDESLNTNFSKVKFYESLPMTEYRFNIILNEYEKKIDKDIKDKLNSRLKLNRKNIITESTMNCRLKDCSDNNLSKIKKDRCLSNRDIEKLSDGKIGTATTSLICNGKINPTIRTKCKLAEILDLYISDIFPKDYLYSKIRFYDDYIELNNNYRDKINSYINKCSQNNDKKIVQNLSNKIGIRDDRLYLFLKNNPLPHKDLEKIDKCLKTLNI